MTGFERLPLRIGLSLSPTWLRAAAWRREDSRIEELFDTRLYVDVARAAERAHLDFVFKPDTLFLDRSALTTWPGLATLDPAVMLAAIAPHTSEIGLVTTASTHLSHPFHVARQIASLDSISNGRAGWNVVTALGGHENFGSPSPETSDERYRQAHEFVGVVRKLWRSFPATAIIADRESGYYADPSRVTPIDHHGEFFQVAGPLDVPTHADRRIPILQAGGSPAGLDLAGAIADAVFCITPTIASGVQFRERLTAAAIGHGREATSVAALPGLAVTLAQTVEQAHRIHEAGQLADRKMPTDRTPPTHWSIVGTPDHVITEIAERYEAGALDGVIVLPGGSWDSIELFLDRVLPGLVDRGLFHAEYTGCFSLS